MRFRWTVLAGALAPFLFSAGPALADVAMSGTLTATQACPAYRSFRQATNPGDIRLVPGTAYPLIAKNKADASHYRIRVDGADPAQRWVEIACGTVAGDAGAAPGSAGAPQPAPAGKGASKSGTPTEFLLALSWQPSFCETRPQKSECRSQTAARPDAARLSLHGLWPQPRGRAYCNVPPDQIAADNAGRWDALPAPQLGAATKDALAALMPGTQSQLDRHEWIKHGTCYGADADTYFADMIGFAQAVNASKVGALLAARVGAKVTSDEIRAAFDASFGAGAGQRVTMQCVRDGSRLLFSEIKVGLIGTPSTTPLPELIAAARPVKPECAEGIVDPAGLQ
ncbi:ribonuclease T2 family protein [Ancylobacter terrae]|uniref:ribonuclease T2 family protein n=1 Tax=Ancylobacter sp. sgz301288 TaxID=3342077 RepID=UPI00385D8822